MTVESMSDYLARKAERDQTLEPLLRRATTLIRCSEETEKLVCLNATEFKKFFETRFNKILLSEGFVDTESFLCSTYISQMMMETMAGLYGTLYAVDYLNEWSKTGNAEFIKRGADTCFLLCSFFPERCERRGMKIDDYIYMGKGLYYRYYDRRGKEIAYYMGNSFETMSEIAGKTLR